MHPFLIQALALFIGLIIFCLGAGWFYNDGVERIKRHRQLKKDIQRLNDLTGLATMLVWVQRLRKTNCHASYEAEVGPFSFTPHEINLFCNEYPKEVSLLSDWIELHLQIQSGIMTRYGFSGHSDLYEKEMSTCSNNTVFLIALHGHFKRSREGKR